MTALFSRRRSEGRPTSSFEQEAATKIAELTASRRAVADAYEVERERIERDLHDGTQQYLVAAAIKLGEAELEAEGDVATLISAARSDLDRGLEALRATVHGVHPQVLRDRGLVAAVRDCATTYGPDVEVYAPHPLPELSSSVLAAGYFFSVEALTNCAKHAPGAKVSVLLTADSSLNITVLDQGHGGAEIVPGHGLEGMRTRLEGFGATLELTSPPGGPTQVRASIPLLLERGETGIPEQ